MNLEALKQTLESLDINPDEIEDEIYAKVFCILFAIIEILSEEIDALKSENQKPRDEINLLKGEQTKPKIRGSKKNDDISSENERRERNPRKSRESSSRKDKIKIHHTETCRVDKSILSEDAVFNGYRYVTIRDIIVEPWNTSYRVEIFYSPLEGKTYSGKLPDGVKDEFGPDSGPIYPRFTMLPMFQNPKYMNFWKIWVF